jgi:endonuclease-3
MGKKTTKTGQGASKKTKNPDGDHIYRSLQSWRDGGAPAGTGEAAKEPVPSVSTVAERYRQDPWAVLVSTILSLRTKDEVTLVTSKAFLKRAPTPAALLDIPEEEAAKLAYPAGFYRTKAANLKRIARILMDERGGQVPADMEALLALPGVGRKTANLVLIEAFDLDGVCVDIHVHRICNRLGAVESRSPDETELILRQILPRQYWKGINALLVLYGQRVCRPVSPYCSRCVIRSHCERRGVEKSR